MRRPAGVVTGLLSKEHSVATGLLIALTAWTLTRLVDGITGSSSIEYDVRSAPTKLASGEAVSKLEVTLTNLSSDETVTDLTAAVSDPHFAIVFIEPPECHFDPPSWIGEGRCDLSPREGLLFTAPTLVSGSSARFAVRYRGSVEPSKRPIVRIKSGGSGKLRLITPGVETFIVRHESAMLLWLLGLTLFLLVLSVRAGVKDPDADAADGSAS